MADLPFTLDQLRILRAIVSEGSFKKAADSLYVTQPAAIKQRNLQLLLQVLDLKADGGLGDVKTVGGLLEAALTDNRAKDPQLVEGCLLYTSPSPRD